MEPLQIAWCLSNMIEDFKEEHEMMTSKPGGSSAETDPDMFNQLIETLKEETDGGHSR